MERAAIEEGSLWCQEKVKEELEGRGLMLQCSEDESRRELRAKTQKEELSGRLVFGARLGLGSQVFFRQVKQLRPSHRGRRK